jgi:hypothetical protein
LAYPFDEDADVISHLAAFGPAALAELLLRVLEAPGTYRTAVLRALTARPTHADLVDVDRDGRHRRGRQAAVAPGDPGHRFSRTLGRMTGGD